jgi:hypothetical protein
VEFLVTKLLDKKIDKITVMSSEGLKPPIQMKGLSAGEAQMPLMR